MIFCSHAFAKINLKNTKVFTFNLTTIYNTDIIPESNKTPEERLKNGEAEK